jgi:hypothetical protein
MTTKGRKPEAILAEKEDNLAEMKKALLRGETNSMQYYRAARSLAEEITELREKIEASRVKQ